MPISGKERAAKHYEANKAKILEKKRLAYAAKKLLNNPQPVVENEPPIEIINEEPIKSIKSVNDRRRSVIKGVVIKSEVQEPIPTPEPIKSIKSVNDRRRSVIKGVVIKQKVQEPIPTPEPIQKPVKKNNKLSGEPNPIMDEISQIINSFDDTQSNKDFRIVQMKIILKMLNPKSFKSFISMLNIKPAHNIEQLKNYEYKPGLKYKNSSLLIYVNTILYFLDRHETGIKPNKKSIYQDANQILKSDSSDDSQTKKNENKNKIPTFQEYEENVDDTYGNNSREYLITQLYKATGARDDLILQIIKNKSEVVGEKNYLVINNTPNAIVILNKYKTKKKYGIKEDQLSSQITELIKKYLKNHKLSYGDYLFNTQSLSLIVSRMNKKMDFQGFGAINLFRKMLTSEVHNSPNATTQDKLALAKKLKHSLSTAKNTYNISSNLKRKIIN